MAKQARDPLAPTAFCDGVTQIPLSECQALEALYNSTNGATWTNQNGWMVTTTPCSWYGVTCSAGHVTALALGSNNLTGTLPLELSNLANLQWLYLHANQLSGTIPSTLGNLANLQRLYLHANQLSGTIPSTLGNLGSLQALNLYSNQLNGTIPPELGNLTSLQYLHLYSNQLDGAIPPELGNLATLRGLHLGPNQLSGSIPPELGNLVSLEYLVLADSQLSGGIPAELGNLTSLLSLNLYSNQLSGTIPSTLGNLANLQKLHLSYNQLSGQIPPELGNLTNLEDLNLYSNQLNGTIPPELGNLAKLQGFSLGSNQLSGGIPPELGNLTNIEYLDLYSNQLSGTIPPELGNLANLQDLYLAANQLSGTIPATLGNLPSLQYLSLHTSQLSGPLPAELTSLAALLGFAFNNTDLCEPQDSTFQTWLTGIDEVFSTDVPCRLTLTKEAEPEPAVVNELLTYTLILRNVTNDTLYGGVVLIDTLPINVTFVSADPEPTTQQDNILSWEVGLLAVDEVFTAEIVVQTPSTPGEIYNQADASATASPAVEGPSALAAAESARARFTIMVIQQADSPVVAISRSGDDVVLSWAAPTEPEYPHEVWWGEDAPYFAPGADCGTAPNCALAYGTSYIDAGAAADLTTNRTYVVFAVTEADRSGPSNRVAEFGFSLVPGN